jgi:hypothetical protein
MTAKTIVTLGFVVAIGAPLFTVAVDYLWTRPAFCTEGILRKDAYGHAALECETVSHQVENVPGANFVICRCVWAAK